MSKRDNKRFNDNTRSSRPKRSGKNRRDYGDNYVQSKPSRTKRSQSVQKQGQSYEAPSREWDNVGTDGLEVVVGRNPIIEVLKGDRDVERVFIAEGAEGSIIQIKALAKEKGVIVDIVDKKRIESMAAPGERHQGVAAKVSEYKYSDMEDIFARARKSGEDPLVIILDEITDPHNLGAIIRTAECVGAHGIIIPKRRACTLTQTVAKSAAGAIENMPVVQVTNISRTIDELKERGLWIGAADMDGEAYYSCSLDGAIGIVIGNEGKGISRLVKERCDFVVSIPMKGRINSLNASNAAAIIVYEVRRQRDCK